MAESNMNEMKRLAGITSQFPDWKMSKPAKTEEKKPAKKPAKKPVLKEGLKQRVRKKLNERRGG